MARFQVAYNPTSFTATVQQYSATAPGGSTIKGNYYHYNPDDGLDSLDDDASHTHYHHVQEILYKTLGIQNMQKIKMVKDSLPIKVISIDSTPNTVTMPVGGTQQITNTIIPSNAANQAVTYVSTVPSVATVSGTGLITGVALGNTAINVTTTDGNFIDTVIVHIA